MTCDELLFTSVGMFVEWSYLDLGGPYCIASLCWDIVTL